MQLPILSRARHSYSDQAASLVAADQAKAAGWVANQPAVYRVLRTPVILPACCAHRHLAKSASLGPTQRDRGRWLP